MLSKNVTFTCHLLKEIVKKIVRKFTFQKSAIKRTKICVTVKNNLNSIKADYIIVSAADCYRKLKIVGKILFSKESGAKKSSMRIF